MQELIEQIKSLCNELVNTYNVKDITIYIDEQLDNKQTIRITLDF